jgi:hypothetical protein
MRETVVLFEVSDFTLEEIHKVQGGSLSGVKLRLKRGRELLAKTLGVSLPSKVSLYTARKARAREPKHSVTLMEEAPILILANQEYAS